MTIPEIIFLIGSIKNANKSLRKFQKSFDTEKRHAYFTDLNKTFYRNLPFSPLFYHPKVVALPGGVMNFPFNNDEKLEYQISHDWILRTQKRF